MGQQPGGFQPFPQPQPRKGKPVVLLSTIGLTGLLLVLLLVWALTKGGGEPTVVEPEYQNEDYTAPSVTNTPPELPVPTTEDEANAWLTDNGYYAQTLATPVRCDLPGSNDPADTDYEALQSRQQALVECLTRVVGPALEASGFQPVVPRVTVYEPGTQVSTQCGVAESYNAFYCPADQSIFLAPDIAAALPTGEAATPHLFDLIIAHEYAHSVQGRSGILGAMAGLQSILTDPQAALELERRNETQADCWANTTLSSLATDLELDDSSFADFQDVADAIGDDNLAVNNGGEYDPTQSSHGTGASRRLWSERGAQQSAVASCNTWTADASEVR